MKYLKQFTLILAISFIGELLKEILPLPVPASIYGMVLLFLCLETGIIRLSSVKETAKYLIEIMPLMFIPAGVGLLESWGVLYPILVKTAIIIIISTIVVMAVSGKVTQGVIRHCGQKKTLEAEKNE
ncbi:CidA/LrgA family protein [bacterium D16-51]|nr:CidA/LrgA family protein [bacterium D16-59]RKI60275.1 CidA/LrgA family protein [bacterium D16-51]